MCKALCELFIGKHNAIYERATFNSRYQQSGASAENCITDFHKLAEHCQMSFCLKRSSEIGSYWELEMQNSMAKTVTQVRQNEVKKQQPLIRREKTEIQEVESWREHRKVTQPRKQ